MLRALSYAAVCAWIAASSAERVCAEDAKKFCSEVRPGGGRVYKCLTDHNADLAPACRERLTAAKARWDEFVADLKREDYARLVAQSGISREEMREAAQMIAGASLVGVAGRRCDQERAPDGCR